MSPSVTLGHLPQPLALGPSCPIPVPSSSSRVSYKVSHVDVTLQRVGEEKQRRETLSLVTGNDILT